MTSPRSAIGNGLAYLTLTVILSWAWKADFRHGPLEWLLRKVAG